jgi:hypothetical protein
VTTSAPSADQVAQLPSSDDALHFASKATRPWLSHLFGASLAWKSLPTGMHAVMAGAPMHIEMYGFLDTGLFTVAIGYDTHNLCFVGSVLDGQNGAYAWNNEPEAIFTGRRTYQRALNHVRIMARMRSSRLRMVVFDDQGHLVTDQFGRPIIKRVRFVLESSGHRKHPHVTGHPAGALIDVA